MPTTTSLPSPRSPSNRFLGLLPSCQVVKAKADAYLLKCIKASLLLLACVSQPSLMVSSCCRDVCVCIPWACSLHQPAVFQHIFGRVEHCECTANNQWHSSGVMPCDLTASHSLSLPAPYHILSSAPLLPFFSPLLSLPSHQVLCLAGRAVNIFPLSALVNRFRSVRITFENQFIMWFSGKRHTMQCACVCGGRSLHLCSSVSLCSC